MHPHDRSRPSIILPLIYLCLSLWLYSKLGPLRIDGQLQPLPALIGGIGAICFMRLLTEGLKLIAMAIDWNGARTTTGREGTARWANRGDLKGMLSRPKEGPFWGRSALRSKFSLFIEYASNAVTIAPAGSGKGIYAVITNIFSIRNSKVIADFKGELACIMLLALRAMGESVRVLNPSKLWSAILGQGDSYNPLDMITDSLHREGGLRDIPDDLREIASQIFPEPAESSSDNTYFREGGRDIISDAALLQVMVEEYDATLSSVALLIQNQQSLDANLRWVVGVDMKGKPLPDGPMPIEQTAWAQKHDPQDLGEFCHWFRARAQNLLNLMNRPDTRTFDSFVVGAQQSLAPFAFGRLAPAMGRSTFRMDELKEGIMSLFIVADSSRMEIYKPYVGLIQWCALTTMKRHPDKNKPVYFIMDEATNYKIHDLVNLLTWGRSYGIRLHLIFQDINAFERIYGETAVETLLSETEIKQILPGQRSPKTLELLERMFGKQAVIVTSTSGHAQDGGLQEQVSESSRSLMEADAIRRTEYGILMVRNSPPILFEPVSYAEIEPWRSKAGINPFHGKPFLKKVKINLGR